MRNKMLSEQELTTIFENDSKNINPGPMVGKKLKYTFMVKSSSYKIYQNSFLGMFYWFFSWSNIPVKTAFISMLLFLSIANFQPTGSQFISPGCDTTLNSIPLKIDSADMLPFYADTCILSKSLTKNRNTNRFNSTSSNGILIASFLKPKTIFLKFSLSLLNYSTFPISLPTPYFSPDFPSLQKLRPTASNNTSLFESPLVA